MPNVIMRVQNEYDSDAASNADTIDTGTETLVRQEFKDEVDINRIVSRFGLNAFANSIQPPEFGDRDFNLDLQTAQQVARDMREAWATLPPDLVKKYPTWLDLLAAVDNGEITSDDIHGRTNATTDTTTPEPTT